MHEFDNQIVLVLEGLVHSHPGLSMILMVLGTLVVFGQTIVGLTPTKKDDEAWEKIKSYPFVGSLISALTSFAVIQKK